MSELMEVKVLQRYNAQSCITTFHYLATGIPAAVTRSFGLMAAMGFISGITPDVGDIMGKWLGTVSDELSITEVTVKGVYSVTDFYTLPLSTGNVGTDASEAKPSFEAFAYQTSRVRSDIRRGNRRLVGVTTDAIQEFGEIASARFTSCTALAGDFGETLTYDDEGNTLTYVPCIVSKEKYQTPAGYDAYRYYATELLQADHIASGIMWVVKPFTSTQVSRKVGRGV